MTASSVYYGWHATEGVAYDVTSQALRVDLKSRTHYFGYEGEELTDYIQNFMLDNNSAAQVKDTTIYAYKDDILFTTTTYTGGSIDSDEGLRRRSR